MSKSRRKKKKPRPQQKSPAVSKKTSGGDNESPDRSLNLSSWFRVEMVVLVASLLILATWPYAVVVQDVSQDFYYLSAQEDEYLEWGTFWAFMAACGVGVFASIRQFRTTRVPPWFLLGVALFCFFVAMEEISWGQRVFGYRPPVYFLENNFQQELNVHNVISTKLRKLAVKIVILGFGVVLPVMGQALRLIPDFRKFVSRFGLVVPPVALVPTFSSAFYLYQTYPWDFTGEWVELMLGLGFLFAAFAALWQFSPPGSLLGPFKRFAMVLVVGWFLVVGVGVAHAQVSHLLRGANPEVIETARGELEALRRDFTSGKIKSRCNRHRRLNTFRKKYDEDYLLEGEFAALTAQGLPEDRAEFFIDPWNSPYWIRDRCNDEDDHRIVFVYSFGPNRRRESSRWEILGDDVGTIIYDGRKVKRFPGSR